MALETIRRSDYSGQEIPRGQRVRVRLMYDDDRPDKRADLTIEEAEKLLPFAVDVEIRPTRRAAWRHQVERERE